MTPEQIKMFLAEREANRKWLAERIEQLDREIHDLRCRLVGVKMNNPPGKNGKEPGVEASPHAGPAPQRGDADIAVLVFAVVCAVWLVIAGAMGWLPGGGMTLRDAMAMSVRLPDEYSAKWGGALIGEQHPSEVEPVSVHIDWWMRVEAVYRYRMADAMLKAREAGNG